jgi:hypothetical protein
MVKKWSRLVPAAICVLIVSQSAGAIDAQNDGIDDRLIVSVAAPGHQSFQDTDLVGKLSTAVLSFDDINGLGYCDAWTLNAGRPTFTEDGSQTGESIIAKSFSNLVAKTFWEGDDAWRGNVFIGYGSGTINCYFADELSGAGRIGWYVKPSDLFDYGSDPNDLTNPNHWTFTFNNRQEYLGFWWTAGNDENYVQLLDQNGSAILEPLFSTASLNQTLFQTFYTRCIVNNIVNAYCGNPNGGANPGQPYAFIHMRFVDGFYGVRFSGSGFEFDNVTISEEVPDYGQEEQRLGADATTTYTLATSPVIPVDPRSQSVSFPGIVLGGAAASEPDATLCLTQVTDSSGTTAVSSGDATISLATPADGNISPSGQSPNFVFSGSQIAVENFSSQIRIVNSVAGRSVVTSNLVWIRVSVSPASSGGEATCTTTAGEISSAVVELRPLRLTNKNQSQVSLD